MIRFTSALAVAALLAAGVASAQTAHPATPATAKAAVAPKPAPAAKPAGAPVAHSAASIDCSKQADAKGLHGKARKAFRSSCKASAKKS